MTWFSAVYKITKFGGVPNIHGAHAVFRLGKPSSKKENLFLYVIFDSSYTLFFTFIGACFFNQRSCLRYFNANFSPANLTAYVANVNPALTSHVLDDIKICFLKARRADANTRLCRRCVGDILYYVQA